MPLPFDATLKTLVEQHPRDWLNLLGLTADGPIEVIDADVSTVSSIADRVIRIGGDRPWILHIEFQVSRDPKLALRLLRYNVLLSERHGVPVLTIVILLRVEADDPKQLTGQFVRDLPGWGVYHEFRYKVVRVWEQSPETFLQSGPGLLPLAPVTKVAKRGLPLVIQRMERLIGAEPDRAKAADLWTATYVLMGLRYKPETTAELLKGVRDLEESMTYQFIINKGREQGFAEGEAKGEARGKVEGVREVLLRVGRKRLGEPSVPMLAAVNAVTDAEELETLVERVLEVENWAELFAPPKV